MGIKIEMNQVQMGMITDQPVYKQNGVLLVASQTTITPRIKELLAEYLIEYVEIKVQQIDLEENSVESIRKTETYKVFKRGLLAATATLKDSLYRAIYTEKPLDLQTLVTQVDNLFRVANNSIQLLDMMYCMRYYDDLTYIHCINVGLMCNIMGGWLGLSQEDRQVLSLCGLLHDIGKVEIPQEIVTKPGKLTAEETTIMKRHPIKSYELLEKQIIDERIKAAAYMHHEKCDGTGYPKGLSGSEINDFAKIVTIIDVYDAMTADRVYRPGICPFKVIDILINEGFKKYDPRYLLLFLERMTETYINKPVRLSNGQIGRIIMINRNDLARPVIQVGKAYINLSKNKQVEIEEVI